MADASISVTELCRHFEDAEEATADARKEAERDRDYYDEKQWTAEEKSALEKRGQPAITFNRVKRKINAMQGLEKQTRKDPKAFPRNPDDEEAAKAATDAIRYVCDDSRWDDKRSECGKELAIEGTCAVMVGTKETKQGLDPTLTRIAWDRFYYDPHSSEFDFADAAFMGQVLWMDLDDATGKFPEAEEALLTTWKNSAHGDTYDDKPKHKLWADHKRRRVRLCEHYYREAGKWMFCIFTQGGFVVEPMDSPYLGEDDQPECPIKAVSLYIDRDNNRYGEVRTMIGPQDVVNKAQSKFTHTISQRQVRVSPSVAQDPRDVRKELSRADGVFIGEKDDVEVLPTQDIAAASFQMMQVGMAEIDLLGPNAALNGKNESDMSGRAILAQQQGGMVEAATYLDRVRVLSLAVYRSIWARVRQHWQGERWVRVTDTENNLKFVGLNRQITLKDAMRETVEGKASAMRHLQAFSPELVAMLQAAAQDPNAQAMVMAIAQGPQGQQVIAVENNVTELDVDVIVDEGVDTPTIAAEQFDQMLKMAGAGIQIPPDVLIEASSLRNKDKLLEMLKQPPSPEQQAMSQLQVEGAKAEVEKTQSETVKNLAAAEAQQAGTQINALSAGVGAAA